MDPAMGGFQMTAPQKGAARALCTADFDARGAATVANQGKHQVGRGWGASWSQWCIKMGFDDDISRKSFPLFLKTQV